MMPGPKNCRQSGAEHKRENNGACWRFASHEAIPIVVVHTVRTKWPFAVLYGECAMPDQSSYKFYDLFARIARERDSRKSSASMNELIKLLSKQQDAIKAKINAELSKGPGRSL